MDEAMVDAYLDRIGASRPPRPDIQALADLHEKHVLSVPFENLAYFLGESVAAGEPSVRKVVRRRRGGNCLELNSAFLLLLRALGFDGSLILGRVARDGVFTQIVSHFGVHVRLPGGEHFFVDVGHFNTSLHPLRLDYSAPQPDAHGRYSVTRCPDHEFEVDRDGVPHVRMELTPVPIEETDVYEEGYRLAPDSLLTRGILCYRPTRRGKVRLSGRQLVREENGEKIRTQLETDDEMTEALATWFGISGCAVPAAQKPGDPVTPPG